MTCTRPQAESQKRSLDPWAPSTHDPLTTCRALVCRIANYPVPPFRQSRFHVLMAWSRLGEGNETTQVHHVAWRHCSGMAARGARAAAEDAPAGSQSRKLLFAHRVHQRRRSVQPWRSSAKSSTTIVSRDFSPWTFFVPAAIRKFNRRAATPAARRLEGRPASSRDRKS